MKAFEINNKNIKVLYRIAISYFNLKEYDKCIEICKMSIELENTNIIQNLYKNAKNCKYNELIKTKKMYSKMF